MSAPDLPAHCYAPRVVSAIGVLEHEGWRLKVAGIAADAAQPRPQLVQTARATAVELLPLPAVRAGRYGVGFLGVHDGQDACFVYVDWWVNENELIHRPFVGPRDDPTSLRPASPEELGCCVWDLALIFHERNAWIRSVMDNPDGPDLERYLVDVLTGEV